MPNFIDLTGRHFGRWTVLRRTEDKPYKHPQFLCRCECGNEKVVTGQALRTGKSKSCGCYNAELRRDICIERNTTHGLSGSRTYTAWINMVQRCTNNRASGYQKYGARGITVCDRWLTFESFLSDMGECPLNQTIDRIDNNKGYSPDNCRWATMKAQQNNRTNNRRLEYNGRSLTLQDWSAATGIKRETISRRLEMGWSIDDALTVPPVMGRNQYASR